jgi:phage shock protein C
MIRGRKFTLDRANRKLLGVCSGIAEATGWDATLIRVAFVVATIAFHWTALAYLVLAFIGRPRAAHRPESVGAPPPRSAMDMRRSTTELDRRLAEVETYVASQNDSLAREIESLR